VIINQATAEKYFPGENSLGKRLMLGVPENLIQREMPEGFKKFRWLTVVGVVKNLRDSSGWLQEFQAAGYTPLAQAPPLPDIFNFSTLLVRSSKDPLSLVSTIRRQIHSVDPDLPLGNVSTMEDLIDNSFKPQRFNAFLMGLFAVLALLLAVVGLYGVLSYMVVQRRHEIGVRLALGAQSRSVVILFLKQGLRLTLLGMAIGLAGAYGLMRLLERLLFGVSATDLPTFISVAMLLALNDRAPIEPPGKTQLHLWLSSALADPEDYEMLNKLKTRLHALLRISKVESELDEELRTTSNNRPNRTSACGWTRKRRATARHLQARAPGAYFVFG
jgi:putative ABC transport system permease protein